MAFAILGLRIPGITIDDADCVRKSNPWFWDQLDQL
jgi:5-enolpyruvylshikimate-3-phosphate synthase